MWTILQYSCPLIMEHVLLVMDGTQMKTLSYKSNYNQISKLPLQLLWMQSCTKTLDAAKIQSFCCC